MKRPLAAACFAFALTRLAASYLPPVAYLPLAAVFVCWLLFSCLSHKKGYWVLLPVCILAAVMMQTVFVFKLDKVCALAGEEHRLSVRVESASPGRQQGSARAELRVYELNGKRLPKRQQFGILCDDFPEFEPGEAFEGTFLLTTLEPDRYRRSLLSKNIYLTAECKELRYIGWPFTLQNYFLDLRQKMSAGIRRSLSKEEGTVLAAMSVGDDAGLPPNIRADYRRAGASHLLVVSGLHLSLLCGAFLGNRSISGKHRRARAVGAICMVIFLTLLTGANPSVRRAAVAAIVFYLGNLLLESADSFTSLGIAAFFAGFSGPYAYCDLGLQLSFTATIGILTASGQLCSLRHKAEKSGRWSQYLWVRTAELLLCPLMAALFTLPIQLLYGLELSGVSVLTNLLVTLFAGPVLVCGFSAGVLSLIPGASFAVRVFALIGGALTGIVNQIVHFCAELPIARLLLPREFSVFLWVVAAACIFLLRHLKARGVWWAALYLALCPGILCYSILTNRVVRVQSVGRPEQPCMILQQKQETIVVLQGEDYNEEQVRRFLEKKNIPQVSLLVDLRKEPRDAGISARQVVNVCKQPKGIAQSQQICGIITSELQLWDGALFLADIRGYKVALATGTCPLDTPLKVDFLLAGETLPQGICAGITAVRGRFDWQNNGQAVYYAPEGFLHVIRPGVSAQCYGGSNASQ